MVSWQSPTVDNRTVLICTSGRAGPAQKLQLLLKLKKTTKPKPQKPQTFKKCLMPNVEKKSSQQV